MRWLRKLRGILGTGGIWGAAGAVIGSVVSVGVSVVTGLPLLLSLGTWLVGMMGMGFVLGCGFAGVLTLFDGKTTLERLTPARAAGWGALAGAAVPVGWMALTWGSAWTMIPASELVPVLLAATATYGATGGMLAAGTVWAARRAEGRLGPGDDVSSLAAPADS